MSHDEKSLYEEASPELSRTTIHIRVHACQKDGEARGRRARRQDFPRPQWGCLLLALSDPLRPQCHLEKDHPSEEFKTRRTCSTVSPSAFPLQQSPCAPLISFSPAETLRASYFMLFPISSQYNKPAGRLSTSHAITKCHISPRGSETCVFNIGPITMAAGVFQFLHNDSDLSISPLHPWRKQVNNMFYDLALQSSRGRNADWGQGHRAT